jgi:hypothetical protein
MTVKEQTKRLAREYVKPDQPCVFVMIEESSETRVAESKLIKTKP